MNLEVEQFIGELRELREHTDRLREERKVYVNFIKSLLDPEKFGHAVSAEVRDEARKCIGLQPVEQKLYR